MEPLRPQSAEEFAAALGDAGSAGHTIRLGGAFSKDRMAGPVAKADVTVSTTAMNRVLLYEPRDLTISVEAGMPWSELSALLSAHRQMIPLDPPFSDRATVGGVVAANMSGPRRRLYGTARDVIIGMKFATLEGKLVQSGGMVVKNVAGLDMAKLMIGSFGTLAGIAVVNFKVAPMPVATRTFVLRPASLEDAIAARNAIVAGALQPSSLDLVNSAAATRIGLDGHCVLLQAGGSAAVLDRYSREFPDAEVLEGDAEAGLWQRVREFTPGFLNDYPGGAVVRISTTLAGVRDAVARREGAVIARAGTGVVYAYLKEAREATLDGHKGVVEFAPEPSKPNLDLWPAPGSDFEVMVRIKGLFDPKSLLNKGRLYGRI
jgi:glycolate oxidase FAD binding subunit